jgi:hypothetical protein
LVIIDLYFGVADGGSDDNELKKAEYVSFEDGFILEVDFKPIDLIFLVEFGDVKVPGAGVEVPNDDKYKYGPGDHKEEFELPVPIFYFGDECKDVWHFN